MIPASIYRKLFPNNNGTIGYVPMIGNVGDTLIEYATLALLRKWNIPHEIIDANRLVRGKLPRHITHLYIAGGGNMGDMYPKNKEIRDLACSTNLPVSVLPQSFTNANEDASRYKRIWVREKSSLRLCPEAKLAPDMAMSLNLDSRASEARKPLGAYLREDYEALFAGHSASYGDPTLLGINVASYIDLVAPYRHIVTDRLHFAITAMLMHRKVTLLPNSYDKNQSMWETWLQDRGCLWADHPDSIKQVKTRRATKLVPTTDSLMLNNNSALRVAKDWQIENNRIIRSTEQNGDFCKTQRHVNSRERVLWEALQKFSGVADLKHVLSSKCQISRFDIDRQLNQILRKFFSIGAIEIDEPGSKSIPGGLEPLGGDFGVPIEIAINAPIQIGVDYYQFADVRFNGEVVSLWYRYHKKLKKHIANPAHCFLLSMLHIAMKSGSPLWVKGCGIDTELLRNLQQFQHIWSIWHKQCQKISIYTHKIESYNIKTITKRRAIACFSGGIDSSFTLFHHCKDNINKYPLPVTDALLIHGFDIDIDNQAAFDTVQQQCENVAADLGINLITLATNIRKLELDWGIAHGAALAGAMHLVAAKFTHGLIPSTLNFGILYPWGSTPLTDPLLSSTTLEIVPDGSDHTRMAKLKSMRKWEVGTRNLRFCWKAYPEDHNCGRCAKCTITAIMIILANADKNSIKPFPSHKRLSQQLKSIPISRLDKSDFGEDMEALAALETKHEWAQLLLEKLSQV